MKHDTQRIDDAVETICNKGCQLVRDDLQAMERGETPPELEHLNRKEIDRVHNELSAIMAVYGDACRIPE